MSRRADILESAARLFHERGFHGVGVDEIGARVGISGPALYRHFSGKDEILATLLNEAMDRVVVDTTGMFDDPQEELRFVVLHHARFVVAHRPLVAIYAHEHRSLVEPWRRMFLDRIQGNARRWEGVLLRCYPDVEAREVTAAVHAALGLLHSVAHWPAQMVAEPGTAELLSRQVLGGLGALQAPSRAASDRVA